MIKQNNPVPNMAPGGRIPRGLFIGKELLCPISLQGNESASGERKQGELFIEKSFCAQSIKLQTNSNDAQ
jgi:hypothetical protein